MWRLSDLFFPSSYNFPEFFPVSYQWTRHERLVLSCHFLTHRIQLYIQVHRKFKERTHNWSERINTSIEEISQRPSVHTTFLLGTLSSTYPTPTTAIKWASLGRRDPSARAVLRNIARYIGKLRWIRVFSTLLPQIDPYCAAVCVGTESTTFRRHRGPS